MESNRAESGKGQLTGAVEEGVGNRRGCLVASTMDIRYSLGRGYAIEIALMPWNLIAIINRKTAAVLLSLSIQSQGVVRRAQEPFAGALGVAVARAIPYSVLLTLTSIPYLVLAICGVGGFRPRDLLLIPSRLCPLSSPLALSRAHTMLVGLELGLGSGLVPLAALPPWPPSSPFFFSLSHSFRRWIWPKALVIRWAAEDLMPPSASTLLVSGIFWPGTSARPS